MHAFDRFKVLGEFWPHLRMLSVFNADNFRGSPRTIFRNICRAACIATFIAMQILITVQMLWSWADDDFSIISRVISTSIVGLQMIASNISLMSNNRKIGKILNHIEMVVNSRM